MPRRRFASVMAAFVVVVSMFSFLALSNATAAKPKAVVATGSVSCTKVTGSITFKPPVRHIGTQRETQTVTFHASRCTTHGSNVKYVTSGSLTVVVHRSSNSCVSLLSSELPKGTGSWSPRSIHPTTASFTGFTFIYAKSGDVGFRVPNAGGSAKVTGSFMGKDRGKRSTASVYTNQTPGQFRSACLSPHGLSKQAIVSGSVTFS